jgi:hypothetical protein
MKIWLGEEYCFNTRAKIYWIQNNFHKDQYQIIQQGFLINEYFVKFAEERYATLYYLHWPME